VSVWRRGFSCRSSPALHMRLDEKEERNLWTIIRIHNVEVSLVDEMKVNDNRPASLFSIVPYEIAIESLHVPCLPLALTSP